MPARTPAGVTTHRPRESSGSADADEVDDEDERGPGLDDATGTALAVGLVCGDGQPAATADLHAGDALVPALDDHADTQPELQRVAPVPGRVELFAAVVGDADVVRAHQAPGGRRGAVADHEVLDHQVVGGGTGRRLDVGTGQLCHGVLLGSAPGLSRRDCAH